MTTQKRAAVEQWRNAELAALKRTALPLTDPVTNDLTVIVNRLRLNHITWRDTIDRCSEAADILEGFAAGRTAGVATAVVPDGWKLVPVEPTEEMRKKSWRPDRYGYGQITEHAGCDVYRTMIEAAPQPPAQPCASKPHESETQAGLSLAGDPQATQNATPPLVSKRAAALALYQPPFSFHRGYIYDANHQMVSDDQGVEEHVAERVRGWGRIGYMSDGAALQDEVGHAIAEALNAFWGRATTRDATIAAGTHVQNRQE